MAIRLVGLPHQLLWTGGRLEMRSLYLTLQISGPAPVKQTLSIKPDKGLTSACRFIVKSSTGLPMRPSQTVTLLLSLCGKGLTFSKAVLCPGCAQSLNNSCKHLFSYLPF